MNPTRSLLFPSDFPAIYRQALRVLQLNLGYLCNLSCVHCHVNAGPKRTELMSADTLEHIFSFLQQTDVTTLDLTGGAPEMHPAFKALVTRCRKLNIRVIDRCNLTILEDPRYLDLAEFLAEQEVEIIASLPCYLEENVDKQRGKGVFKTSISALQRLNALGYGQTPQGLSLNLVYNPQGAVLPPAQHELEAQYQQYLSEHYGISFTKLLVMTNMPIQRFGSTLVSKGCFASYLTLLKTAFRDDNLTKLMCLDSLSIDWQGYVYDCDFNQMLAMPLGASAVNRIHITELIPSLLAGKAIATAEHCYGCTAGQGSSCGGALNLVQE
ncbi:MAG: arsenosugar biosynthesis radical SAM (seleno)protein ArsS [Methylovulum sp.]|jgi:radical SAM/Cys-rich protein